MVEAMQAVAGRQSRFWLFAPFVLLAILAVGWTVAWFWIRHRTAEGLDAWLAHEVAAGRRWACADRAVGGYPFRIEVSCSALTLQRGGTNASLGRLLTVAQMYRPGHVIAEIGGPLRAGDGQGFSVEADWRLLQVSIQGSSGVFQRASLVADDAKVRLAGLSLFDFVGQARHVEAHVRPDPARQAEGAYDAALSARGLASPALNDWTGEDESADLEFDTTIIQGRSLTGGPFAEDLERWREAGGAVQIERATLAKGARRLEAKGSFRLDGLHRPAGQLDLTAVGFDDLIPTFPPLPGGAGGLGGFLGGFLGPPGRPPLPPSNARPAPSKLSPLPPLRLDNGRVYLGPIALPGIRLTPLY